MNFYNDHDKHAAAWLRQLIADGHLPPGDVSETSITELNPDELSRYTQVHLFCGIGGWPLALRLAGWPDDRPVWTGSCPCQAFSVAGKGKGQADERHLWPAMFRLIRECKPDTVFGEQVSAAIRYGWLDGVSADLEADGYAVGACVLGAHSIGAPHIRQRLFWVAGSEGAERQWSGDARRWRAGLADGGDACGLVNADRPRCREHGGTVAVSPQQPPAERASGPWGNYTIIPCGDGKSRRIEPGLAPLVARFSGRVGLLRGYGNAIVPPLAAEFVKAFMELERTRK